MVVVPGFGADQAGIGHPVEVLPLDGIQGESLTDGSLCLWVLVVPILPYRLPEGLLESGLVPIPVLGDDRQDGPRVG